MLRNGDATERLLLGIKDVQEFRGFTAKIMDMVTVFRQGFLAREEQGHRDLLRLVLSELTQHQVSFEGAVRPLVLPIPFCSICSYLVVPVPFAQ